MAFPAGRGPASARESALDPGGFILGTSKRVPNKKREAKMGLLDRLLGRGKKAAGDLMGDASMRREGAAQEREGAAEDRAPLSSRCRVPLPATPGT